MTDILFTNFMKRWEEVTDLPPQQLGRFTNTYKLLTSRIKIMPWFAFFAVSAVVVGLVYGAFGSAIVWMVSLLQKGF